MICTDSEVNIEDLLWEVINETELVVPDSKANDWVFDLGTNANIVCTKHNKAIIEMMRRQKAELKEFTKELLESKWG